MNDELIKRLNLDKFRAIIGDMECMGCGTDTPKEGINIHHINLDSTDNRLSNLSLICKKCHFKAHQNADGGWRRSLTPSSSLASLKKNHLKTTWMERFNSRYSELGGVEGFKQMYLDPNISTEGIGIKFKVTRERIRQFSVRIGLPPRGKGFMTGHQKKRHGFPYPHKPLSDYLYTNGLKPIDLAEKTGRGYASVMQLLNMNRPVSRTMASEIVVATNGVLTMEELMNPLLALGENIKGMPA